MDTEPLLIPIPAVQAILGNISRTTVHELFKSGDLKKVRIGSRSFATTESVTAYVARLSEDATTIRTAVPFATHSPVAESVGDLSPPSATAKSIGAQPQPVRRN